MEPIRSPNGRPGLPPRPYLRLAKFERLSGRRADVDGLVTFLADAANLATQITTADGCCEIRLTTAGSAQPVRASSDVYAAMLGSIEDNLGEGPHQEAVSTLETCYVPDFRIEQRWPVFIVAARLHGFGSMVALPLTDRSGGVIGTLALYSRRTNAYTATDQGKIAELAAVVADIICRPRDPPRPRMPPDATAAGPSPNSHPPAPDAPVAPAEEFAISCSEHDGVIVVAVSGEVDVVTSPLLRHELLHVLWSRPARMIMALERVPFIDAAGLGALAVVSRYAHLTGTRLRIAGPSRLVRKMLTLTGMDKTLAVYPSFADALSAARIDSFVDHPDVQQTI